MGSLLRYAIPGVPFGCIYALVAVGLVLTYRSSGVFNLAFGAQAYVAAAIFYDTRGTHHWPTWAAFIVSACVRGTSSIVEFTMSIGESVLSTWVTGEAAA